MQIFEKLIALEQEATEFGFNWERAEQIMNQIKSECHEIEVHIQDGDKTKLQEEIGDLMHAVFSLCLFYQLNPQETLQNSLNKFAHRFQRVKELAQEQGLTELKGCSFDVLMDLWTQAKEPK